MLKGQCQEMFCFRFFHDLSSPKPLKIALGSFQIFFQNSLRYLQVKLYSTTSIYDTGVNDTDGK
jgi:hypothetical protein